MDAFLQEYSCLLAELGTVACARVAEICETQSCVAQWASNPVSIDNEKKLRTAFIFLRAYM